MVQITSVGPPFNDPELAGRAYGVLKRAHAMGLLGDDARVVLDAAGLGKVLRLVRKAGIGRDVEFQASSAGNLLFLDGKLLASDDTGGNALGKQRLLEMFAQVMAAMEASPQPASEWKRLGGVFEADEMGALLGISPASLRRYQSNDRETPDEVAARLHYLALITADLAGAYNEIGIRRWFQRKRALLGGRTPAQLLRPGWQPEDDGAQRVAALARSLTGSPAT